VYKFERGNTIAAPKMFLPDCTNLGPAPNWAHLPYITPSNQNRKHDYVNFPETLLNNKTANKDKEGQQL
jgi:hypothetical protein